MIVVRHLLSEVNLDQNSNLELKSNDKRVKISIPVEQVLQETRKDPGAIWVCYQATFSQANPVAGYSTISDASNQQFYLREQPFIQIGTLDNTGTQLVDKDGIKTLYSPFKMEFVHSLEDDPLFFKG